MRRGAWLGAGLVAGLASGAIVAGLVAGPTSAQGLRPPASRDGGAVSLSGAVGAVPDPGRLGPVHLDPLPPGVSLDGADGTTALLARSGAEPAVTHARATVEDSASGPVGTPAIAALSRHVQPSCSGTGADGHRVQVLYLHAAGAPSRYRQVLPVLRNEVANVDDVYALSARETGGERRVRWVHDAGCQPVIRDVAVPAKALGADFWATVDAVKARGYTSPARKYLMFADASRICGIGTVYDDPSVTHNLNDGRHPSYARVDTPCWSGAHSTPAHELTHMLGGVQPNAPHATRLEHCWDESDLMCYDDGSGARMRQVCPASQEQLLDCHHDDYFDTDPPRGSFLTRSWNTARSSFLDDVAPPADRSGPPTRRAVWSRPRVSGGVLAAALRGGSGHVLARHAAAVQARWRGAGAWVTVAHVATDGAGVARARPATARAGWFRFAAARVASGAAYLRVSVRLHASVKSHDRVVATLVTSAGSRVRGAGLALQRRAAGSSHWVGVGRARTDASGRAVRRVPTGTASYRWVFAGEVVHGSACSRSVRLR